MKPGMPNAALARPLLVIAALVLSGCWTPPRADIKPRGDPGFVETGIRSQSVVDLAIVQSVDSSSRVIMLMATQSKLSAAYAVAPKISGLAQLRAGDRIRATVIDDLSIYVLPRGRPLDNWRPDARVLAVDRSYRLLTVRYPNGYDRTYKVHLDMKLRKVQPGDAVRIRPVELVALSRRN